MAVAAVSALLHVGAPPAGLPAGWIRASVGSSGPAAGSVWQGRIPNTLARWDTRRSAVYLPPGYDALRRYPVVYLLHGMPGSPSSFSGGLRLSAVADGLIVSGRSPPFIAVMPAGGPIANPGGGEWAGIWERYLVRDVVPWVDAHLPTLRGRRDRALEGLCAGGFGALDIGLRHPGLFGTLGSWEGYFAPVFRDGPFVRATRVELAAHDPTLLVRREAASLRAGGTHVYVSAGGNHGRVLRRWSISFARDLSSLRIPHELWLLPRRERGHFWRATLPSALLYATAGFRRA